MAKILVVDDDPKILDIVQHFLGEAGYQVHTTDKSEGAAQLASEIQPDLILLDIRMPGKDGYAVLDDLKKDRRTGKLPVIIITGKAIASHVVDDTIYGLNDILAKPFSKQDLVSLVKENLDYWKRKETNGSSAAGT